MMSRICKEERMRNEERVKEGTRMMVFSLDPFCGGLGLATA